MKVSSALGIRKRCAILAGFRKQALNFRDSIVDEPDVKEARNRSEEIRLLQAVRKPQNRFSEG